MPNNLTTYTTCTQAPNAASHKNMGGFTGWILNLFMSFTTLGRVAFLAVFIATLIGLIMLHPISALITYGIIIASLLEVKYWYYNKRLLCVGSDEDYCLVGTVIQKPYVNFDGDAIINVLPAPYTEEECVRILTQHIFENEELLKTPSIFVDLPFHNGIPVTYPPAGFDPEIFENSDATEVERRNHKVGITEYLDKLRGLDPLDSDLSSTVYNNILIGFCDRLFSDDNLAPDGSAKNFYKKYFKKDPALLIEGSLTWEAIPRDFDNAVNWQAPNGSYSEIKNSNPYELNDRLYGLNNMFKFENKKLLPFMHCEVDGNALSILLDAIMIVLSLYILAYLAIVALIAIAPVIFFILAWIIIILVAINLLTQTVGFPATPEIDYVDPDDSGNLFQGDGDTVALYGKWIMDTEHGQHFEIHPVKAYYVIGRNSTTGELEGADSSSDFDKFGLNDISNEDITEAVAQEICMLIHSYDETQPEEKIERDESTLLSYGLNTKYSGGRFKL